MMMTITMNKALKWLKDQGGSGVIDRYGRVLSGGDLSKYAAVTWLRLVAYGKVTGIDGRIGVSKNGWNTFE